MESISFIGGDNRNLLISEMFREEREIYTYGIDENNYELIRCINNSKYIVVPIPFSTDDNYVYMPLSDIKLEIKDFIKLVSNKIIIGGMIKEKYIKELKKNGNTIIDVTKNKDFIAKNTIPTAEGTVKIIIENTDITIDESNIAVLGFGNVGKQIAKILKLLNANIFCHDINAQEVANIRLCGYNVLEEINNNVNKMNVIVNTVPELILDEKKLKSIDKNTLIIDVASAPGGVDFKYAKEKHYKVIQALGLPGKIAPKTSAKYVKDIIENIII